MKNIGPALAGSAGPVPPPLSRALRALETPEEKLVRREIRNEKKNRARRRRAKTKQEQVAK